MPIRLPDFRDDLIYELSACACAFRDDNSGVNWPDTSDLYLQSQHAGDGHPVWIRLVVNSNDVGHRHIHVDVSRHIFDESSLFSSVEEKELVDAFALFHGLNVDVSLTARYCVEFNRLPKRGILRSLFEVSTEACGSEMHLSGATMDISSDLFDRVSWHMSDIESNKVDVKLEAESESVIDDDYLESFVELMRDGLDCFVFESSKEKAEHVEARPLPQKNLGT